MRVAFFYPWFTGDRWSAEPPHAEPLMGRYESLDVTTLRLQIALAQWAGIEAFVVSWWGEADNERYTAVANVAAGMGFKVCPHVETDVDGNPGYAAAVAGITQTARLRVKGWPVVFAYRTWSEAAAKQARLEWAHVVTQAKGGHSQYVYNPSVAHDYRMGQCFSASAGFWHSKDDKPTLARDLDRFRAALPWMNATEKLGWPWQVLYWNEWAEGTQIEPDAESGMDYLRALRDA